MIFHLPLLAPISNTSLASRNNFNFYMDYGYTRIDFFDYFLTTSVQMSMSIYQKAYEINIL